MRSAKGKGINTQMILLQQVQLPFINHVLKSMKYSIVKSKQKNVRTFSGSTCFQAATESYCPANNNTRAKLVPYNPSDECTFEKKLREKT